MPKQLAELNVAWICIFTSIQNKSHDDSQEGNLCVLMSTYIKNKRLMLKNNDFLPLYSLKVMFVLWVVLEGLTFIKLSFRYLKLKSLNFFF